MKFKFLCPQIKPYQNMAWNMAMPICLWLLSQR